MTPAEMQYVCSLVCDGRAALANGDFVNAEKIFTGLKQTSTDAAARNCARLHLAVVFGLRYIPGICTAEAAENLHWIEWAEEEYREVLANDPTEEQRACADRGLDAMQTHRRLDGESKPAMAVAEGSP
jgi:hypothetical protein